MENYRRKYDSKYVIAISANPRTKINSGKLKLNNHTKASHSNQNNPTNAANNPIKNSSVNMFSVLNTFNDSLKFLNPSLNLDIILPPQLLIPM